MNNIEEQIRHLQWECEECERIWNSACLERNKLMIKLIDHEWKLIQQIQSVQE